MRKALGILLCLLIWASNVFSDQSWQVNGHVFSNVNAMQSGKEVTVSGRVSGGGIKNPLAINLYVQNDSGKTYRTSTTVKNFCGKGELFESSFTAWERARWWKVVGIESN